MIKLVKWLGLIQASMLVIRERGQGYDDEARSQNNAGLHVARGRARIRSKMENSRSELELGKGRREDHRAGSRVSNVGVFLLLKEKPVVPFTMEQ